MNEFLSSLKLFKHLGIYTCIYIYTHLCEIFMDYACMFKHTVIASLDGRLVLINDDGCVDDLGPGRERLMMLNDFRPLIVDEVR